jgi:hypothetical protein
VAMQWRCNPSRARNCIATVAMRSPFWAKILLQASPLASPLWRCSGDDLALVEDSLRVVVDYRMLNTITKRDRFPLPRIEELFDAMHGCSVFSTMDLQSGYHQILIHPDDIQNTAFVTPVGQFQFKVFCFGLTNAPATFQRVVNSIFEPTGTSGWSRI